MFMCRKYNISEATVVVTGATSGIGFETVLNLTKKGAFVIGVGRSQERCDKALEKIMERTPDARVCYTAADLSSLRQVRDMAAYIKSVVKETGKDKIDVLINNAGTFSNWYVSTEEGFELQFTVNHLAPFLLTYELMPLLGNSEAGKVITVSSGSHYRTRIRWNDILMRKHYNCLLAYKQTKLANVLFSTELNRRLGPSSNVRAFAFDPGLVNTDIGLKGTAGIAKWIWLKRKNKGTDPEIPASAVAWIIENVDARETSDVYWKGCRPKAPSRYSQREDAALRLWEISEKMCGIKWFAG
jgi:NAD(P)-dependent dehydrogenase (short-subunit alcohol dehydrogenase family)